MASPSPHEHPITPWPLSQHVRRAILVGGTFDPPHRAHIELALSLRQLRFPDAGLLFIPAAVSPFKVGQAQTSAAHRIAMLHAAIHDLPVAAIWTDEVDRAASNLNQPSFTVDTLRRARRIAPHVQLVLVLGTDQAVSFHKWREFREIMTLANLAVLPRGMCVTDEALRREMTKTHAWSPSEIERWVQSFVPSNRDTDHALAEVSSSRIRSDIASKGASAALAWLHPDVVRYIERHALYTNSPA